MAAIHELLRQVEDPALRKRLEQEIDRLTEHKKFGLVFEEHLLLQLFVPPAMQLRHEK